MPFIDLAGFNADDVIPSIAKKLGVFREDASAEQLFDMLKLFLTAKKKSAMSIWTISRLFAPN